MRGFLVLTALFSSIAAFTQKKQTLLHLPYGKYSVGLSQKKISYKDSVELLITIWQPAMFSKQSLPLTIRDCFELDKLPNDGVTDSLVNNIICGDNYRIQQDTLSRLLSTKTNTSRGFSPLKKKFPVVVWSYRHGTEYYQFAMNEYLASHGFLVFTVSRLQPAFKMPWDVDAGNKLALHQEYLSDMDVMLREIKKHPQTDTLSLALFSWSYGGDGAIFFQQNHPEIDAVFGFSSVDFSKSFFLEEKMNLLLHVNKLNRPYYLFYEEISRRGNQFSERILHPAVKRLSSVTLFPRLWHGNFNYMEGYVAGQLNLPVVHPWSKPGIDAMTGYEVVCQLALFHIQYLFGEKADTELNKQINNLKQKLPDGFIK